LNQALKQRLVGTLVLGCLAIIFIPLLLDGEGVSPVGVDTRMPEAPALSYEPLPLPERPVIDADALSAADAGSAEFAAEIDADGSAALTPPAEPLDEPAPAAAASASATIALPVPADRIEPGATAADSTPRLDASGLPESWTVRLGAFSNPGNADKLRACLIASGYQAYSRLQPADSGSLTHVFVGPQATRAEATALAGQLQGKCELTENGIAVRYTQP